MAKRWISVLWAMGMAGAWIAGAVAAAETVPRMDKETLKKKLDDPDVIVVDVRIGKDWAASEYKIKNARRLEPTEVDSWKEELPEDKTIVLYCA